MLAENNPATLAITFFASFNFEKKRGHKKREWNNRSLNLLVSATVRRICRKVKGGRLTKVHRFTEISTILLFHKRQVCPFLSGAETSPLKDR